mgnify:CR=1 FL=1
MYLFPVIERADMADTMSCLSQKILVMTMPTFWNLRFDSQEEKRRSKKRYITLNYKLPRRPMTESW